MCVFPYVSVFLDIRLLKSIVSFFILHISHEGVMSEVFSSRIVVIFVGNSFLLPEADP